MNSCEKAFIIHLHYLYAFFLQRTVLLLIQILNSVILEKYIFKLFLSRVMYKSSVVYYPTPIGYNINCLYIRNYIGIEEKHNRFLIAICGH